ncbi:hypothetical protein [Halorubrum sp. 2020YC2]|uniref:hypothetical protein n=1 Tax=Halorubrum sp. 2020YC2 TaxID=2836432 RepID=UPI0020367693|nr:hypothetical protein [Halorubrum sp. 2020YC2]
MNHYRLIPETRTVVIEPKFDDPETEQFAAATGTDERTVDLTEVDALQLIPLGPIVAARLHYRSLTVTKPEGLSYHASSAKSLPAFDRVACRFPNWLLATLRHYSVGRSVP